MATYVAFLRAINLGAKRKFSKDAIKAAVESTGATDVATYINTGNVLLSTRMRSKARIEEALEEAFFADRGFEVPTYVFTPAEILDIVAAGDALQERVTAEHGPPVAHYVTLYRDAPSAEAAEAAQALSTTGELIEVDGRAAHVVAWKPFHEVRSNGRRAFADLGEGTARTITVLRTLAEKWCAPTG